MSKKLKLVKSIMRLAQRMGATDSEIEGAIRSALQEEGYIVTGFSREEGQLIVKFELRLLI